MTDIITKADAIAFAKRNVPDANILEEHVTFATRGNVFFVPFTVIRNGKLNRRLMEVWMEKGELVGGWDRT